MKALDSFTVERLEEILNFDLPRHPAALEEIVALARIALAAKRAEPVYQYQSGVCTFDDIEWVWDDCDKGFYEQYDPTRRRIVYTTPRLNSPEVSDGWKLVPIEPTQNMVDAHISGMQLAGFSRAYRDMLAAAPEPQNQQQNIPENIPQGWIKCSDQMPEDDTLCLGVDECGVIWTMHFDDGEFRADTGDVDDLEISHWMPLPDAPEKENG
ncbi:TPA: DUF551 domain-containing protein [Yersinia enterocolitica]|uniref:DUF551 domain-containing protein n=3 Tax=Yersinia enterocolitica TaxID=630 RepID=UPI0029C47101|nr:DUF551 domain-containing protein [Yersinia enterocolitica]HEI6993225.1 DUF551 domain-containing protein [Yersinia enterocolitica]